MDMTLKPRGLRGAAGVVEQNATEDGMMAFKLEQSGGKIKAIDGSEARVWTSDRRIQLDGGLKSAFIIRVKKYLFNQ